MNRTVMHVDMDAFFASVEEMADPSLRGRPLVVAGPGDRSIITTASYAARKFGVRTGMTVGQARILHRGIVVVRADYRKYSDASRRVMEILESVTPEVQAASVDEAYLDVSAIVPEVGSAGSLGGEVRRRVHEGTGLSCSVGIAENRLLAKLASGMNKPGGVTILSPDRVGQVLEDTPVGKLCGIGPVTARALHEMGIETCGQLGRYPREVLVNRFGSCGVKLSEMGRGEESTALASAGPDGGGVKSIGHSATLARDVRDKASMERVLQTLSEMVGRRARRHGCAGSVLTMTWRYDDFTTHTRRSSLRAPVCLTRDIYRSAVRILRSLEVSRPVRLLGLSLSGLTFEGRPGRLFPEDRRMEMVQEALDEVNDRYGEFTLRFGETVREMRTQRIISPSWRSRGIRNSS